MLGTTFGVDVLMIFDDRDDENASRRMLERAEGSRKD
jgi:hypothetical protein